MEMFELKTAAQMRDKLQRELQRFKDGPRNVDWALNFFLTAECLRDWTFKSNGAKKKKLRNENKLVRTSTHLANGTKHFILDDPDNDAVESANRENPEPGYFSHEYFAPSYFGGAMPSISGRLTVKLSDGRNMDALDLACQVMAFWESFPVEDPDSYWS